MSTLIYIVLLSLIGVAIPGLSWIVVSFFGDGGGVADLMLRGVGMKPWVTHAAAGIFAALSLREMRHRKSRWFAVATTIFGATAYVGLTQLSLPMMAFFGGFVAVMILANSHRERFWQLLLGVITVQLGLSAAVYFFSGRLPLLSNLDGGLVTGHERAAQGATTFEGVFARIGFEADPFAVRGSGIYYNPNCWAQVSGWCVVVGAALIRGRGRQRTWGASLIVLGLAGLVGAGSRSAYVATACGALLLAIGDIAIRSRVWRLLATVVVAVMLLGVMTGARRAYEITGLAFGSDEGVQYRLDQALAVGVDWSDFILMGRAGGDQTYDPHDLVTSPLYYFGLPALLVWAAIVAGIAVGFLWVKNGRHAFAEAVPAPKRYAHLVSALLFPLFAFYVVAGVGNGLAGGVPYNQLFFIYLAVGHALWRGRRARTAQTVVQTDIGVRLTRRELAATAAKPGRRSQREARW